MDYEVVQGQLETALSKQQELASNLQLCEDAENDIQKQVAEAVRAEHEKVILEVNMANSLALRKESFRRVNAEYGEKAAYVKNYHLVSSLEDALDAEHYVLPSQLDSSVCQAELVISSCELDAPACVPLGTSTLQHLIEALRCEPDDDGVVEDLVAQVDCLLREKADAARTISNMRHATEMLREELLGAREALQQSERRAQADAVALRAEVSALKASCEAETAQARRARDDADAAREQLRRAEQQAEVQDALAAARRDLEQCESRRKAAADEAEGLRAVRDELRRAEAQRDAYAEQLKGFEAVKARLSAVGAERDALARDSAALPDVRARLQQAEAQRDVLSAECNALKQRREVEDVLHRLEAKGNETKAETLAATQSTAAHLASLQTVVKELQEQVKGAQLSEVSELVRCMKQRLPTAADQPLAPPPVSPPAQQLGRLNPCAGEPSQLSDVPQTESPFAGGPNRAQALQIVASLADDFRATTPVTVQPLGAGPSRQPRNAAVGDAPPSRPPSTAAPVPPLRAPLSKVLESTEPDTDPPFSFDEGGRCADGTAASGRAPRQRKASTRKASTRKGPRRKGTASASAHEDDTAPPAPAAKRRKAGDEQTAADGTGGDQPKTKPRASGSGRTRKRQQRADVAPPREEAAVDDGASEDESLEVKRPRNADSGQAGGERPRRSRAPAAPWWENSKAALQRPEDRSLQAGAASPRGAVPDNAPGKQGGHESERAGASRTRKRDREPEDVPTSEAALGEPPAGGQAHNIPQAPAALRLEASTASDANLRLAQETKPAPRWAAAEQAAQDLRGGAAQSGGGVPAGGSQASEQGVPEQDKQPVRNAQALASACVRATRAAMRLDRAESSKHAQEQRDPSPREPSRGQPLQPAPSPARGFADRNAAAGSTQGAARAGLQEAGVAAQARSVGQRGASSRASEHVQGAHPAASDADVSWSSGTQAAAALSTAAASLNVVRNPLSAVSNRVLAAAKASWQPSAMSWSQRLASKADEQKRMGKEGSRRKLGKNTGSLTATVQQGYMLAPANELFPNGITVPRLQRLG